MPEVVNTWVSTKDIESVNRIQKQILTGYENDFGKHSETVNDVTKISIIWESIVSQLARENKKFLYQVAKDGARAREYEAAVDWLNNSNIVNKIFNVTKPDFPLNAYTDLSSFKLYMLDVGLLRRKANLDSKIVIEGNKLFEEFKGALTENFILNMLLFKYDEKPNYYTFNRYEIDFIIQDKNEIIPIEVKSSENRNNVSLTRFNEENENKISVRFSTRNLDKSGKVLNIPIFMVEYIDKLLELGLK
jgi:predicted AAA+ superfamily ATPase